MSHLAEDLLKTTRRHYICRSYIARAQHLAARPAPAFDSTLTNTLLLTWTRKSTDETHDALTERGYSMTERTQRLLTLARRRPDARPFLLAVARAALANGDTRWAAELAQALALGGNK